MIDALRHWLATERRALREPQSLRRSLALTVGGLVLLAIVVLAMSAVELLRKQAEQQALARVQLAGVTARDELRRLGEDALTAARVVAARPALQRLVREGDREQLELVLRRSCELTGMSACAITDGAQLVLGATRGDLDWPGLLDTAAEQGERFMLAPATVPDGLQGATATVPGLPGARVVVLRFFDARLVRTLGGTNGVEVRLVRASKWLDNVEPALRGLHSTALASGGVAAERVRPLGLYAASVPLTSVTGEAVALLEVRLPSAGVDAEVDLFVRRLAWTALVLGVLAVAAGLLVASRIVGPLQSLAESANRLGRGDFSTSISATGGPETAALARTLEDMRRSLLELTATLRQREAEAQALLRGVVEGVFAVDADRNLRYLNPQAEHMLGVGSGEALGRFCGDVLKPCVGANGERPCETDCPIVAARGGGPAQATEFLQRVDGARRTAIITSARMVDGLQVQVMRDETDLESARRARDSILANISHEFRTPLAAQLASLELLQDHLQEMPREQLGELVESLQRGTLRLTRLIDNLLESVRIESGQLGIRSQRVALEDVVRDAGELVIGLLAQREQDLEVALPEFLPDITGDAPRLTQVFVNLLANANKFGPAGSTIRISGEIGEEAVSLWVEDEGPGVADPDRGSIFERFYRAADQEPEPRGLGLGLWIVKSIVERHGGRVSAARTEAGRTRFTVSLPLQGPLK
ncbi:MAG TPA: ATP-binding protein [Steroidobacteraceae bacterium]|nr:ATP-binding protein [Steroidobacteraceae bacterium]